MVYYVYSENFTSNANPSPTPIFGPAIEFAGQAARWTGDSFAFRDQIGIEARVNFESFAGDRVTSYLTIVNNGTTSIYYDWKVSGFHKLTLLFHFFIILSSTFILVKI